MTIKRAKLEIETTRMRRLYRFLTSGREAEIPMDLLPSLFKARRARLVRIDDESRVWLMPKWKRMLERD